SILAAHRQRAGESGRTRGWWIDNHRTALRFMNEQPSKIYLIPNLMTAGNLFCGFTATLKILEGALLQSTNADAAADLFHAAIWFILGAFVFDFLDGRLARLGGHESAFGREFDSLAHIVFALARRRRTPSRPMEIRFATAAAFPFLHDVQSVRISQFQSHQLENEEIDPALSRYFCCSRFYRDQLRMDAGDLVSRLFALRFSKAVALARMAPRDRGRDR